MQKVVFQGGHDLLPRMIGRAALFQAYTSMFAAPALALGYVRAPPGLEILDQSKATPVLIAAFGIGFYLTVKNANSRLVSKMTFNEKDATVKIETVSSVGRIDPSITVPLQSITASSFAPSSTQILKAKGKSLLVNHAGGKYSDISFFSSLGR